MSRSSLLNATDAASAAAGEVCGSLPDLLGRTALPLLAALPAGARVLFLVDLRRVLVNRGGIADGSLFSLPVAAPSQLPLGDRTIDCVVLDTAQLDPVSDRAPSEDRCRVVLEEVRRVLKNDGDLVLLTEHRRFPQDWRQLRRYRLVPPDRRWGAAVAAASYHVVSTSFANQEGPRLTGITGIEVAPRDHAGPAESKVLRCRPNTQSPPAALVQEILAKVAVELDAGPLEIVRFAIRKIGKTSITVALKDGRRYLIRVPRATVAAARARRNYTALETLSRDERLPVELRRLVPRPIVSSEVGDFECYVEECIAGSEPTASLSGGDLWRPGASSFLMTLHTLKRYDVVVDEGVYRQHFGEPLETIRRYCEPAWARETLDRVEQSIRGAVYERTLPLTWTHGDFFDGNCLTDASGRLTGVVDWELFSTKGLPLLDLLQSMSIPGENNSRRWQRFDRIVSYLAKPQELLRQPLVANYLRAMAIPDQCVSALLRMYWVDHVANRIAVRRTDSIWLRKRVYQPLEALSRLEALNGATVAAGAK
jgi:aminoglycoside phosphotransferase (APT) family kinase protein